MDENVFSELEEYICFVYGHTKMSVNTVSHLLFKESKENDTNDILTLPLYQNVSQYHSMLLESHIFGKSY